mmetsp:Transcript_33048/g.45311  ORF Transcript_33048/g.45311 Transcript_33048/m.45311 type:complete len:135 (+) Transcript_33048:253-657(+)
MKETMKSNKYTKEIINDIREFLDDDPYDKILDNNRKKFTKEDFAEHFNVQSSALCCMISGLNPEGDYLCLLSRLLPRKASYKVKESLQIGSSDIESIRNFLILCEGFRNAFNAKYISFIPTDEPFSNYRYKLKI